MNYETKLARAKAEYQAHKFSGCIACRNSIYDVNAPVCSIAQELDRRVHEIIAEPVRLLHQRLGHSF